jgi:hypothetical protein
MVDHCSALTLHHLLGLGDLARPPVVMKHFSIACYLSVSYL